MELYPAIDVLDGGVVRIARGRSREVSVYHPDPVAVARHWVDQGARALHVVDLNRALGEGEPNLKPLEAICAAVRVPVQAGGGVRSEQAVRETLAAGAVRVTLGGAVIADRDMVGRLAAEFGDRVAVAIDVLGREVRVAGWQAASGFTPSEVADAMVAVGVRSLVYTDIARDGTLSGLELGEVRQLMDAYPLEVRWWLGGGVATLEDLRRARAELPERLAGIVVGKALYDRRFTVREAQAALAGAA